MLHRVSLCIIFSFSFVLIFLPHGTQSDFIGPLNNDKAKERPLWSSQFLDFALKKLSLSNGGEKTARRQAIPLAMVQGDILASAKQSKKPDKSNSTDNFTSTDRHSNMTCNQTIHNETITTLHDNKTLNAINKTVHLMNSSMDTRDRKSVTRHAGVIFISNVTYRANPTTNENATEGPLDTLPQDPNGNGPQEKQEKDGGSFKRKDPDKPQNRTKRQSSFRSRHRPKNPTFPYPYEIRSSSRYTILHPEAEVDEPPMRRGRFDQSLKRLFSMSATGGLNSGILDSAPMQETTGIDPQLMQSAYEKRAYWNPVDDQSFSNDEQLDLGNPDHSYRRVVEKEAMNVDRNFAENFPSTPEKLLLRAISRGNEYRRRQALARAAETEDFVSQRENMNRYPSDVNNDEERGQPVTRSYPVDDPMSPQYPFSYRRGGYRAMPYADKKEDNDMAGRSETNPSMLQNPQQRYLLPLDDSVYPKGHPGYQEDPLPDSPDQRAQLPAPKLETVSMPIDNVDNGPRKQDSSIGNLFRGMFDINHSFFAPNEASDISDHLPMFHDEAEDQNNLMPDTSRLQEEQQQMAAMQPMLSRAALPIIPQMQDPFNGGLEDPQQRQLDPQSSFPVQPTQGYFQQPTGISPAMNMPQQMIQNPNNFAAGQSSLAQQLLQNYYLRTMQAQQMASQNNAASPFQSYQPRILRRRTMLQPVASVPVVMAVSPQGAVIPNNVISNFLAQNTQSQSQITRSVKSPEPAVNTDPPKEISNVTTTPRQGPILTFTPLQDDQIKQDLTDHKELLSPAANLNEKKSEDTKPSNTETKDTGQGAKVVTLSLQKAIRDVLSDSLKQGKITTSQSADIEAKIASIFGELSKNGTAAKRTNVTVVNTTIPTNSSLKYFRTTVFAKKTSTPIKDKGKGIASCKDQIKECPKFKDGGVCPFMETFMEGMCTKTCGSCSFDFIETGETRSNTNENKEKTKKQKGTPAKKATDKECQENNSDECEGFGNIMHVPSGASMHLSFDSMASETVVDDDSGNGNNGVLLKGAKLSNRKLGTCGKAAEINGGDVSWTGKDFGKKPVDAVTLGMWVKVKKSGSINWFANGDAGKTFYLSTQGTVVPAKVWTHVVGTYDSKSGLSRVFINGDLAQETQQNKGEKLMQDWLVNGIGKSFGDDSIHFVDEIYIFDKALTPSEVHALYNQCQFNRMIIHYGFQRGNSSTVKDQSGLQNDALLIGGASPKDDCDRCGSCLDMVDGPDPTLKIERISLKNLPTTGVSVALWISLNSTSGIHDIFTTQGKFDGSGYHLQVIDGKIRWRIGSDNGDTIFDYETQGIVVPEALWSHVITTYNSQSGQIRVFVNGISKLEKVVDKTKRRLLPQDWENEAKIGGKNFFGYMDEFLLYNWDLDASEALYVRNYCADHPKLVRFTVRVPLTRRNMINNKKNNKWNRRSSIMKPTKSQSLKTVRSRVKSSKRLNQH